MQIKSWKLSSSEWLSSIMSALVMSVRAITPNGIKKKKKNNFRKLFLLVDSFLTLLDIKKRRRRRQRLRWMSEWVNGGGTWGTMRLYVKSEKRSFPPALCSAQRKEDSFLLCIKFTRIMVITLLTLYLTPPPPSTFASSSLSLYLWERERHSF